LCVAELKGFFYVSFSSFVRFPPKLFLFFFSTFFLEVPQVDLFFTSHRHVIEEGFGGRSFGGFIAAIENARLPPPFLRRESPRVRDSVEPLAIGWLFKP